MNYPSGFGDLLAVVIQASSSRFSRRLRGVRYSIAGFIVDPSLLMGGVTEFEIDSKVQPEGGLDFVHRKWSELIFPPLLWEGTAHGLAH